MFRFTPVQNIVHIVLGGMAFGGAYRRRVPALGAAVATVAFVVIGAFYDDASLNGFGMNEASGIAHLVVGGAGIAALAAAGIVQRRRERPTAPAGECDEAVAQPEPRGIS
jgi:hypothetical protein